MLGDLLVGGHEAKQTLHVRLCQLAALEGGHRLVVTLLNVFHAHMGVLL
jgi:hypothetical protein